jgi:hypothetical protein
MLRRRRTRAAILSCLIVVISHNLARSAAAQSDGDASSLPQPQSSASPLAADCGIYGAMAAAWGNAPANPQTYECVRIFDSTGRYLIATGVCSGLYAEFRMPLPPGRYIVDRSMMKPPPGEPPKPHARSFAVEVRPGQWVSVTPQRRLLPVP